VVISDTFGRPWREGLVNVAIGAAGFRPLADYRGRQDRHGRTLRGTIIASGDELAAVAGLLGRLAYLASLRRGRGSYEHWGMELVHGPESSERALKTAHAEVVAGILRTPLTALVEDLQESSHGSGLGAQAYVEAMRDHFSELLPEGRQDSPAASHLNSVLVALSSLEKHRGRATRSTS
jgi:hypothetical protein